MMIDLDSFKLVNDLYGHDMGDKVLITFAELLKEGLGKNDVIGRMGGDEFSAFSTFLNSEDDIRRFSENLNTDLLAKAKELMGEDMEIPLGASIGTIYIPGVGEDYDEMIKLADKALYNVKQNGKHGFEIYVAGAGSESQKSKKIDLKALSILMSERNIPNSALKLTKEDFTIVYRYVMRYIMRNSKVACKLLFTLDRGTDATDESYAEACELFGDHMSNILRKTDLILRYNNSQYFVLLTEVKEDSIQHVTDHIIDKWTANNNNALTISYEMELIKNEE